MTRSLSLLGLLLCTAGSLAAEEFGYIRVTEAKGGMVIRVDGDSVGVSPLAESLRVRVGVRHVVVGNTDRYVPVRPGATVLVDATQPDKPVPRRSSLGLLLTGCAVGCLVTVFLAVFYGLQ